MAGKSLESQEAAPEEGIEDAWRQEITARVEALEAGEVELTPWQEIRDRFLATLSERRQA
jgi:hypothetical protein